MIWLLLSFFALVHAQQDLKVFRPCFERYPNNRLVNVRPFHSEWRMKTEDSCLRFCVMTASRCRSVVFDSVQHICHFFVDSGEDVAVPTPKMIYLRVTNRECLEGVAPYAVSSNLAGSPIQSQEEQIPVPYSVELPTTTNTPVVLETTTKVTSTVPVETFTESQENEFSTVPSTIDSPLDGDNSIGLQSSSFAGSFDSDVKYLGNNEIMRDIKTYDQPKRWQSSMEKLEKNSEDTEFRTPKEFVDESASLVKETPSKARLEESLKHKLDLLKRRFPDKYVEMVASSEEVEIPQPVAPVTTPPTTTEKHTIPRRVTLGTKKIKFTEDMMYPKKINFKGDVRRMPQRPALKPVTLPSFAKKARSFLETVNGNAEVVQESPQTTTHSSRGSKVEACPSGKTPIWVNFENSLDGEQTSIDSSSATAEECEEMCNEMGSNSFSFFEKEGQCQVNIGSDGVYLKAAPKRDFSATTSTKFCFSDSLSIFHECAAFVGFREYSLEIEPREQFDGLPKGYEGMQLCIELCVLSTQYTCRSASFLVNEGKCLLNSFDSISRPNDFQPSLSEGHLYFENGCSSSSFRSQEEEEAVSVKRVTLPPKRSPLKMLKIKKIKRDVPVQRSNYKMKNDGALSSFFNRE